MLLRNLRLDTSRSRVKVSNRSRPYRTVPLLRFLVFLQLCVHALPQTNLAHAQDIGGQSRTQVEIEKTADDLLTAGGQQFMVGDHEGAADRWREALLLCEKEKLRECELNARGRLVGLDYLAGKQEAALDAEVELLGLVRKEGFREQELELLFIFGSVRVLSGLPLEAQQYLEAALVIARELGNRQRQNEILAVLVPVHQELGNSKASVDIQLEILAIARKLDDTAQEAAALGNLSRLYSGLGDRQEAEKAILEALALDEKLASNPLKSAHLSMLAELYLADGKAEEATGRLLLAVALSRESQNHFQSIYALSLLGKAYAASGSSEEAIKALDEGVALARKLKVPLAQLGILEAQGQVYELLGKYAEAINSWRSLVELVATEGQEALKGSPYLGIARSSLALDDYDTAIKYGGLALKAHLESGQFPGVLEAATLVSSISEIAPKARVILETLGQSVDLARARGRDLELATLLLVFSQVQHISGQSTTAAAAAEEARSVFQKLGNQTGIVRAATAQSLAIWNSGNQEQAISVLRSVQDLAEGLDSPQDQAVYFSSLAGSLGSFGHYQEALVQGNRALKFAQSAGDLATEANTYLRLSSVHIQLSNSFEAAKTAEHAVAIFKSLDYKLFEARAEAALGSVFLRFEDARQAIIHYENAYALALETGASVVMADSLSNLGLAYGLVGDVEKAVEQLEQARMLYETLDHQLGLAANEFTYGSVLMGVNPSSALEHFRRAAVISRATGNFKLELSSYSMAAQEAYSLGDRRQAEILRADSHRLVDEKGTITDRLNLLINEASLFARTGDVSEGLPVALRASQLASDNNLPEAEARALGLAANFYEDRGEYQKSLATRLTALGIERESHLEMMAVSELVSISSMFSRLGRNKEADAFAREALTTVRRTGQRSVEILVLLQLAATYRERNEIEQALLLDTQGLEIAESLGNAVQVSTSRNQLSLNYFLLGEKEKALEQALAGLQAADESGDIEHVLFSLLAAGGRAEDLGLNEQAKEYYGRARDLAEQLQNSGHTTQVLLAMAGFHAGILDFESARKFYREILVGSGKSEDQQTKLAALFGLAALGWEQERIKQVLPYLEQAKEIAEHLASPESLAQVYGQLGAAYAGMGEYEKGYGFLVQADHFRDQTWARTKKQATPSRFLEGKISLYVDLVRTAYELYVRSGDEEYARDAFRYSEKAKGRNLAETFAKVRVDAVNVGVPANTIVEEQRVRDAVETAEARYFETLGNPNAPPKLSRRRRRVYEQALASHSLFVASLREQFPSYASVKYPSVVSVDTLPLRPGEILVEYFPTDTQTFRWVIEVRGGKPEILRFDEIAVTYDELLQKVVDTLVPIEDLKSNLASGVWEKRPYLALASSAELFELLLGAVLRETEGNQLVIVPDNVLHMVPFEMLVSEIYGQKFTAGDLEFISPRRYVIDDFDVSYAQSASFLSHARQNRTRVETSQVSAFLVGDPTYEITDEGNSENPSFSRAKAEGTRGRGYGLGNLPASRDEIQAVAELMEEEGNKVTVLLGSAANEASVKRLVSGGNRYVHFAAHAILGEDVPSLREPAIVLSLDQTGEEDGFLTLSEILELRIETNLVVLSACSTGTGNYRQGEGPAALSLAFMYAGARSVVASLWEVRDKSTSILMKSFYKHLLEGRPKAQALRLAKMELRREGYDHPYFWAPFILIGE